jgi:biopolymer transport protein ExbB
MLSKAIILSAVAISINFGGSSLALAQQEKKFDINAILSAVNSGAAQDRRDNAAREQRFKSELGRQQGRFNSMRNERIKQENLSVQLERQFDENEKVLAQLSEELAKELGDLKELFGVIQQTASEAQEGYKTSIVSAQFPDRAEKLRLLAAKMGSSNELISLAEIEQIWGELDNELNQQGKVSQFTSPVNLIVGESQDEEGNTVRQYEQDTRQVTRVGVFNAVSDGEVLTYQNNRGLVMQDRQMPSDYVSASQSLESAGSGLTPFYVDPTKGSLLSALVQKPSLFEKVAEGKAIGYLILILGAIAMVIVLFKIMTLVGVEAKVKKQIANMKKPSVSNPLGRVIKVYQDNSKSDPESMELKLGEAILKESPKLNSGLMLVKIIAVVAPLFGLLGTVTGMIQTFQAITLYGAGDPQTMAGGISQALVTTVLGLVVAIPTVLLHSSAANRARRIENTLTERASGLVAEQIEQHPELVNPHH